MSAYEETKAYQKGYAAGRKFASTQAAIQSIIPHASAVQPSPEPPSSTPPERRLQLAALSIGFAKKALDEEEERVREFLKGQSNYHKMLQAALEMMEGAMSELFQDDVRDSDGTRQRGDAQRLRSPTGLPSAGLKGIAQPSSGDPHATR